MQAMVEGAPKLIDFLCEASLAHFDSLKAMLEANGIAYRINPRLVRGMDYYNLTVFEFITDSLGAQGTICAGGRYDYLIEQIGGKRAPAVGWALGVERVLELIKEHGAAIEPPVPDAYAVVPDALVLPLALKTLQALRASGVSVQMHAKSGAATPGAAAEGMGSMKSQFRKADASGARYALVFGADELARGMVTVKSLRDGTGAQVQRPLDDAAAWAAALKADHKA
jgi:histidyl-tRNA synthetase